MSGTLRLRSGSAPTLRDGGGRRATPEADWLIGAELLTAKVRGVALRSVKALGTAYDDPVLGKDPQPAHMDDFVRTNQDNGGVHINSGIPNRAVYLAATAIGGNYKVSGPCRSMGNARPSWRRVQHCPYRIKTFRLS